MMFGPYGYAPYQYGTPQYQQPPAQQLPQSYQQPSQQSGITWVESDAGAENMRVEPGRSALAMNANAMLLYMKTVDPSGIPNTRKFKLVEVAPDKEPDAGQFVPMSDFQKLQSDVLTLTKVVQGMKGGTENG